MRIKAFSPLLDGFTTSASLTTDHSASSYGQPVLVLENGEALGPGDAALADYRLLEATADEVEALREAGFTLPKEA